MSLTRVPVSVEVFHGEVERALLAFAADPSFAILMAKRAVRIRELRERRRR